MIEQREKLIELLENSNPMNCIYDDEIDCNKCDYKERGCFDGKLADHLISNGVVVPIRCAECEYGYLWTNDGTEARGKCAFMVGDNQYVVADGFCNLGERKDWISDVSSDFDYDVIATNEVEKPHEADKSWTVKLEE